MASEPVQMVASSFRDPNGFLFVRDGTLYRQINKAAKDDYDLLMSSGCYDSLATDGKLVTHQEVEMTGPRPEPQYRIIKPARIPFISYPYEWCFSALKSAALLTLDLQKRAIEFGMSLRDASAYNIQFVDGSPLLIDTLSFEKLAPGRPWVAYRQFCQHFLAPLALMSTTDVRLGQLLRIHIDGIPLDLAGALLPRRTRFSFGLLAHIHVHARSQRAYAARAVPEGSMAGMSTSSLVALVENLAHTVDRLEWKPAATQWGDYYNDTNYSAAAFEHKEQFIRQVLDRVKPRSVWDLGANEGVFSRLCSERGILTVAFDLDPLAVEKNFIRMRQHNEAHLLPLVMDLTNPSPGIGWENRERDSLLQRGPSDLALALALVHHLAIGNNLPFASIARALAGLCRFLAVEFIPKDDSQVQRLLRSRADIFVDYDQSHFEECFEEHFRILEKTPIRESVRVLYLMEAK